MFFQLHRRSYLFLLFFIPALLSPGCKKNPFDYRSKYIGDYDFVKSWSHWSTADSAIISGTTYSNGRVEYGGSGRIKIILDANSSSLGAEYKTYRNGDIKDSDILIGEFTKTNVNYTVSGNWPDSLTTWVVTGTKIK